MVLLHGVLDVTMHEARDLPTSLVNQASGLLKRFVCCNAGPQLVGSVDPYMCLDVGETRRLRSSVIQGTKSPKWHERAEVYVADEADFLKVEVKDADIIGAEYMGHAIIPVQEIMGGKLFDKWLPLTDQAGTPVGRSDKLTREFHQAQVHVTIKYIPVVEQAADAVLGEVPRTYFPLRPGNRVTLYHDAVCTPGPVEGICLAGGGLYSESSCWDDIYEAILEAKRFIWITGWSVWDKTRLRRAPDRDVTCCTLGELLIRKAEEGVNVLLLVWDDATNNLGLHPGLMATHDQETLAYFKRTKVTCVLCQRKGGFEETILQKFSTSNMFTHHQKTVVLDAPQLDPLEQQQPEAVRSRAKSKASRLRSTSSVPTHRRVIAFIGGLDLCDGRYDRHDHPLFETCGAGGVHAEDHHQACIEAFDATKCCLREPWHDIHAKVEGPCAMDIGLNFMERWIKQAGTRHVMKMRHLDTVGDLHLPAGFEVFTSKGAMLKSYVQHGGVMMKVAAVKAQNPSMAVKGLPQKETWSVQLFRSIDSDSAEGFPKGMEGAFEAGLSVGKGKIIDPSIQRAYIHLIRHSKRYLYLENQYFLGSSHLWDSDMDCSCYNLVPAEIALKISSKIKAGEPYRVYIVTPMFPEGVPTSGSVQAILHFEAQTRRMMYRRVAAAIAEAGLTGQVHPQDYLQFFCLGKREGHETSHCAQPVPAAARMHGMVAPEAPGEVLLTSEGQVTAAANNSITQPVPEGPANLPPPDPATCQGRATAARRFMIYVHSKLMIVDDEYVVVGSANINQRSLAGTRDSEICIGAFQDGYVMRSAAEPLPQGQVSGFRRALWKEHIYTLGPEHEDPSSLECMHSLRAIGEANWLAYTHPDIQPLPRGHLLNYPNSVGSDGSVSPLPDCEEFPDLGGKILGTKSTVLPSLLTA